MTKLMTRFQKGQKGFTLIELLVVIAILGVIAAVAIPNILNFIGAGETQAALAEQHNVQVAVAAWMYETDQRTPIGEFTVAAETGNDNVNPYLINMPSFNWAVNTNGAVTPGEGNPLA